MTRITVRESLSERILSVLALVVFWTAFVSLAAGLGLWLAAAEATAGAGLLRTGLIGLFIMPGLRLMLAIASAVRTRDWILFGATIAVLAILLALTVRDAATA